MVNCLKSEGLTILIEAYAPFTSKPVTSWNKYSGERKSDGWDGYDVWAKYTARV